MDKVVASAAEAVADIPDGAIAGRRRVRAVRHPDRARSAALHDAGVSDLRVVSNNCGVDELGPRHPARRQAHRADDLVVRRREQGVRAAVPLRRAGGRADAAGHARRAAAGRRRRHPRVLHRHRRRHAGRRGRAAVALRAGRLGRAGLPAQGDPGVQPAASRHAPTCSRRRSSPTSRWCTRGRATGTATSSSARPRATSTRCAPMAGRVTIAEVEQLVEPARSTPRTSTRPASSCSAWSTSARTPRSASSGARSDPASPAASATAGGLTWH